MRIHVVGAAILRDGRCLVAQRSASMSAPHAWEFPGGKVEPGEDPRDALRRELAEELAIDVAVHELIGTGTSATIHLDVYRAELRTGTPVPHEHAQLAWLDADHLAHIAWAEPDGPIVPHVIALL
jgi:8-oxo-dGTP diphosphatase